MIYFPVETLYSLMWKRLNDENFSGLIVYQMGYRYCSYCYTSIRRLMNLDSLIDIKWTLDVQSKNLSNRKNRQSRLKFTVKSIVLLAHLSKLRVLWIFINISISWETIRYYLLKTNTVGTFQHDSQPRIFTCSTRACIGVDRVASTKSISKLNPFFCF